MTLRSQAFRVFALLLATPLVAFGTSASAQQADPLLEIQHPENGGRFEVIVNQAIVINSRTPFAEISIAEPSIADVAGINDKALYLLGKSPGRTTLTLLGPDGELIVHAVIEVTIPLPDQPKSVRVRRGNEVEVHTVE